MSNVRVYLTHATAECLPHTLPLRWNSDQPAICYLDADAASPQDHGWLRVIVSKNDNDNRLVITLPPTAVAAVVWDQGATSPG